MHDSFRERAGEYEIDSGEQQRRSRDEQEEVHSVASEYSSTLRQAQRKRERRTS